MLITEFLFLCSDICFEFFPDSLSLREIHRKSAAYEFVDHKKTHVPSYFTVIALSRFFEEFQMRFKFLFSGEAYAVYSLQDFVIRVTFPVNARMLEQLEVAAQFYVVNMRASAEIRKISLVIARDRSVFHSFDKVDLVRVVLEHFERLSLCDLSSVDPCACLCDFLHLFLDRRDIVFIEHLVSQVHIVVKTFLDDRPYPEFCVRIKMFYRLRHQMRT